MRKHRYIKLVTTESKMNYLVSKPNCNIIIFFLKIYQQQDTENFFVYIKTDNIYKDIGEDVET